MRPEVHLSSLFASCHPSLKAQFWDFPTSPSEAITDHFCNPGHYYSSCCTKKGSRVQLHCVKRGHQFMDKSQPLLHHCLYLSVCWGSCHSTKLLWYCTETTSFLTSSLAVRIIQGFVRLYHQILLIVNRWSHENERDSLHNIDPNTHGNSNTLFSPTAAHP